MHLDNQHAQGCRAALDGISGAGSGLGTVSSHPPGTSVETEFRENNTLAQGTQQGGPQLQQNPGPPHPHRRFAKGISPWGVQTGCHHLPSSCVSPVSFDRTSCKSKVTIRDVSGGRPV